MLQMLTGMRMCRELGMFLKLKEDTIRTYYY